MNKNDTKMLQLFIKILHNFKIEVKSLDLFSLQFVGILYAIMFSRRLIIDFAALETRTNKI